MTRPVALVTDTARNIGRAISAAVEHFGGIDGNPKGVYHFASRVRARCG